ncbi:MAG: hypothetical protein M1821_009612 [Bathelium mastoideum]|nr:MAG: hypothetical protein M1821_009612 [Bathelium mastoideum]
MTESSKDWESGEESGFVSIGTYRLFVTVCGSRRNPGEPIVLVFPGAGASLESWREVQLLVSHFARILLYDRAGLGQSDPGPTRASGVASAEELSQLLKAMAITGPYILVAHSYGGCIAREFLQLHLGDIVGMVLSETGAETPCQYHEMQYKKRVLGDHPLSVIRGELGVGHSRSRDPNTEDTRTRNQLEEMQRLASTVNEADLRLKREQLQLSRNTRFQNVPTGHNVHRERPDIVTEEIHWVLSSVKIAGHQSSQLSAVARMLNRIKHLICRRT